jgi:SAM-dependent methyltransferase
MGSRRGDYGIDAPGMVRGLALLGLACGALAFNGPRLRGLTIPAAVLLGNSALLVWSSRVGKRGVVVRMLDALELRGDERLLDVGCGRGLVLIEAAKRLPDGRAVGVDVWRRGDQSGNTRRVTLENAEREGVADRVKVHDGDARRLPFDDGCFDVVVSSLVVHNIRDARGRDDAMREMARMLRPGGRVAVLDIRHTGAYAGTLRTAGLEAIRRTGFRFGIFPPVRIVTGRKGGL